MILFFELADISKAPGRVATKIANNNLPSSCVLDERSGEIFNWKSSEGSPSLEDDAQLLGSLSNFGESVKVSSPAWGS